MPIKLRSEGDVFWHLGLYRVGRQIMVWGLVFLKCKYFTGKRSIKISMIVRLCMRLLKVFCYLTRTK